MGVNGTSWSLRSNEKKILESGELSDKGYLTSSSISKRVKPPYLGSSAGSGGV